MDIVDRGCAVVAVILLASFASRDDSVPVSIATVTPGEIRSLISTNGKIEPVDNFEAHAPIGTVVKRVLVNEGDHVRKGQLLVELDAATRRVRPRRRKLKSALRSGHQWD